MIPQRLVDCVKLCGCVYVGRIVWGLKCVIPLATRVSALHDSYANPSGVSNFADMCVADS